MPFGFGIMLIVNTNYKVLKQGIQADFPFYNIITAFYGIQ